MRCRQQLETRDPCAPPIFQDSNDNQQMLSMDGASDRPDIWSRFHEIVEEQKVREEDSSSSDRISRSVICQGYLS